MQIKVLAKVDLIINQYHLYNLHKDNICILISKNINNLLLFKHL